MSEQHRPSPARFCFYPYSAAGLARGWEKVTGMEALLAREVGIRQGRSPREALRDEPVELVFSGARGDVPFEIADARMGFRPVPADPSPESVRELSGVWFDELWAVLHPAAFCSPGLPVALARSVFPEPSEYAPGSLSRLWEYLALRRSARLRDPEQAFADRYEKVLAGLPAGASVAWIEIFLAVSIRRHADRLRRSGGYQTLHSFLALPDSLTASPQGRGILEAMSAMDAVYLQTDVYIRRLAAQLETCRLPVPELRRFDLPPDTGTLRAALQREPPGLEAQRALDVRQSALVQDALETRGNIPHRFLCPDRLDPIKGLHVVIEAVDRFLVAQDCPLEVLRSKFRFYFVVDYYTRHPPVDGALAWHRYAAWVREHQIPRLAARWPGLVWFADNIPDRYLWTHLLVDAHVISGGIQEGLGLAVQEGLAVNAELGLGRTLIIGDGAGFALQAAEEGLGAQGWFPRAGDAEAFARALAAVVAMPAERHRERSRGLVDRFVRRAGHRLFDSPR